MGHLSPAIVAAGALVAIFVLLLANRWQRARGEPVPGGGATPGGVALCSAGLLLLVLTAIGDVVPLRGAAAPLVLAGTASLALSASLVIAQMRMLRSRLITSAARSWLDIAGGAVLALGVTWALGAPLLERSTGIGGGWATIVLVPTGAAQIATTFSLTATLLLRPHDPRMRTLTAGAAMLFAAEVAGLAASAGYGPGSDAAAVLRVGVAAALTIAVLLRDPAAGETALESTSDVVIAPVVLTTTSIGMIAWHLVEPLTSAAAWAALLTMVLVTAKTVVVFRQLDALNHIRAQAMTDALTGLGNRRALQEALAGVEGGAVVGLVVIDLDRFKAVNDTLGHAAGDELLVELARRLRESAGSDEVVVRLGGDEFALVVPGADRATARRRAAAAVTVLSRPVRLGHSTASVGASAGVAVAPLHATSAVVLQERADEAMYRAKGLDGTVVVAGDDDAPAPDRRSGPRRAEDRAVGSESIAD